MIQLRSIVPTAIVPLLDSYCQMIRHGVVGTVTTINHGIAIHIIQIFSLGPLELAGKQFVSTFILVV